MPPAEKLEEPVAPAGNRKAQIVYFSHTGNTRTIAGYIHDMVKSDMVELETEDTYTDITIRCWRKSVRRSQMSIVRRLRHAAKTCWIRTNDFSGTCGMNLLDLLRKEEDVEIKWQKILNELYSKLN